MADTHETFDPFAPENFAAASSIVGEVGVEKILTAIPIRKPSKLEWFRAHGGIEFNLRARVIEDKEQRATYLVLDKAAVAIPELTTLRDLTLCVDRSGNYFYWGVPVPDASGQENRWHSSARTALDVATRKWTRIAANMRIGAYDVATAPAITAEPVWPSRSRSELLALAFGSDRVIAEVSHPYLRLLQGLE